MIERSTVNFIPPADGRGKLGGSLSLRLSPALYDDVRRVAEAKGVNVSAFVRDAVVEKMRQAREEHANAGR